MASFGDTVAAWAKASEAKLAQARSRAVEMLGEEMSRTVREGGNVPFLTGNLARSLLASKDALPNTADGEFVGSNVGLVAATLKADEPVWLGYQARYAARLNYGFVGPDSLGRVYNQAGRHFVEAALTRWPEFVQLAVKEVNK